MGDWAALTSFIQVEASRVLNVPNIAADDNFFELGIDSLDAIKLVTHLEELMPVELPLLALLMENPSVRDLSGAIELELDHDSRHKVAAFLATRQHQP